MLKNRTILDGYNALMKNNIHSPRFFVGESLHVSAGGNTRTSTNSHNISRFHSSKSVGITLAHQRRMTMGTTKQRAITFIPQKGEKRSGIERRRFSYHVHIPERRSGQDRRSKGESRELVAQSHVDVAAGVYPKETRNHGSAFNIRPLLS
jgi:hypothetical protein